MNRFLSRAFFALLLLFVIGSSASAQVILTAGVVNAADYSRNFAPGALISVFGSNLASSTAPASIFPLPNTMGGASVELASNGEQFPLWYVSPTQINAQIPYDVPIGAVQVRVRTAAGVSNADTITIATRAPRIFTIDSSGTGSAVATTPANQVLTQTIPANPADTIVLWMNSMGISSGNPIAGVPAPGATPGSQTSVLSGVTAKVSGLDAQVTFAGLSPGSVGLYQVNIQCPFVILTGPVDIVVTIGGVSTQSKVTIPFRQLGFYSSLMGGKAVAGQTLTCVAGANSALVYRQADGTTWGPSGLNAWTNQTGLTSDYSVASGLALTLRNGTSVVYDNNGIETGTYGTFYDNRNGPADSKKPGLSDLFSMSNYFPLVFSGYFKLAQATAITELIGYFDTLSDQTTPFDPQNPYVRYRMNIWSNTSGFMPVERGAALGFTGDVFSSDTTVGAFTFADTGVRIYSSDTKNAPKPLYRLSFRLNAPVTLQAGEYWFSHDASVRAQAASSSTAQAPPTVTVDDLREFISAQQGAKAESRRFSFLGQEMTWTPSWELPIPVIVRPQAVVAH